MPAFRRIELQQAGAKALGVLVPPGQRTLVIIRPRAVTWDLLPARRKDEGPPLFCDFERDEAVAVARHLVQALGQAVTAGACPVETFGDAAGRAFQVWLRTGEFVWIVCPRRPGQPYRPAVFATHAEAVAVGEALTLYLWPAADAEQEYYFNTQLFAS